MLFNAVYPALVQWPRVAKNIERLILAQALRQIPEIVWVFMAPGMQKIGIREPAG